MPSHVAIVTGVTSGLGLQLALRLAANWTVVGVSRHPGVNAALKELGSQKKLHHIQGDVGDPDIVRKTFEEADRRGTVDLVINGAGVGIFGPAGSYSRKDLDEVLQGNLVGLILFSEAAFNRFRTDGGTLVNIMSTSAQVPRANEAIYCAAKWGARGYTEALRLEAKGTPTRVISVFPGGMRTSFWQHTRDTTPDTSKFMEPAEVADVIIDVLKVRQRCYVSDIVISRG